MRRFFFDPENREGDTVTFSKDESRHIKKVLRLQVGDPVELLDGSGTIYSGEISALNRVVAASITAVACKAGGEEGQLVVCQALLKGDKMDTVVQKCTELGVTTMIPFHSSRIQGKLSPEAALKKHGRWERIGLAACKQCMRPLPMEVEIPQNFAEAVTSDHLAEASLRILFWEEEQELRIRDVDNIEKSQKIAILLGPEGGLTPEEVALARQHGWISVSLGKRILRAETATLTAASIVQYLAGRL